MIIAKLLSLTDNVALKYQGSQLSWNSWNFTDVLKLEIVLKFYSFGQNVLKLTFVMLS